MIVFEEYYIIKHGTGLIEVGESISRVIKK